MIVVEMTPEQKRFFDLGYANKEQELLKVKNFELTKEMIQDEISTIYSIPWTLITSKTKDSHVVMARHTYCYLLKNLLDMRISHIAHVAGYKDHTAVSHAIQNIEDSMFTQPETKNRILHLLNKLSNVRSSS